MKGIVSLSVLKEELKSNESAWLLLYKKGSTQSDCAFENFKIAEADSKNVVLFYADVNEVRDIHTAYNITSVPSLLNLENGELKNIVKGCLQPSQINAIFEKSVVVSFRSNKAETKKNVTVYTPTCTWCTTVKRHLQEHGVRYHEIDVSKDQKAAEEMVRKSGQQGVPQTDINGQIVVGFDKTRINALLGIN